jgi:hypothetical protein
MRVAAPQPVLLAAAPAARASLRRALRAPAPRRAPRAPAPRHVAAAADGGVSMTEARRLPRVSCSLPSLAVRCCSPAADAPPRGNAPPIARRHAMQAQKSEAAGYKKRAEESAAAGVAPVQRPPAGGDPPPPGSWSWTLNWDYVLHKKDGSVEVRAPQRRGATSNSADAEELPPPPPPALAPGHRRLVPQMRSRCLPHCR